MNNQLDKKYIRHQFVKINNVNSANDTLGQVVTQSYKVIATSKDAEDYLACQNDGLKKKIIHFMFQHKETIKKIPIIGQIVLKKKNNMLKVTKHISDSRCDLNLSSIIGLPYEEYIIAAYHLILGREPDAQGVNEYRQHAEYGATNEAIAYMLFKSDEFNNRLVVQNIRKYRKSFNRYKRKRQFSSLPIVGNHAKFDHLSYKIQTLSNQLEYVNNRLNDSINNHENNNFTRSKNVAEYFNTLSNSLSGIEKLLANNDDTLSYLKEEINQLDKRVNDLYQEKVENVYNRYYNAICDRLEVQSINSKTSLDIETSISQKLDQIPNFIALNNIKNKSMITSIPGGVIAAQVGDFIMGIPSEEWGLAMFLSLNGHFEPGSEQIFCNLLNNDMTVIDVGANLGIYTLHALKAGCKVYSYEPTPSTFGLLKQNIKVNGFLETKKTYLYNCAVGETNKNVTFSICEGISGHNHISANEENSEYTIEVPVISLDSRHKDDKIDFIKIDIEGYEYEAFLGMRKIIQNNPQIIILMEFAPEYIRRAGSDPIEFLKQIREAGLTIKKIDENSAQLFDIEDDKIVNEDSVNLLLRHQR